MTIITWLANPLMQKFSHIHCFYQHFWQERSDYAIIHDTIKWSNWFSDLHTVHKLETYSLLWSNFCNFSVGYYCKFKGHLHVAVPLSRNEIQWSSKVYYRQNIFFNVNIIIYYISMNFDILYSFSDSWRQEKRICSLFQKV